MKKPKATVEQSTNPLQDLSDRIQQMIDLNLITITKSNRPDHEKRGLEYQNSGLYAVKQLIKQLQGRGAIWKGGYLDNVGVTYGDYMQEVIDYHNKLDSEVQS